MPWVNPADSEADMPTLETQGISQYYELHGDPENAPVIMISGLGGVGASWGPQVKRFSERYHVILPDHRGTGRSSHALDGYTTEQLAKDMVSLVEHLNLAPIHVVGSSTGGAIAQHMALGHPHTVRSLTLSSTFARFDAFTSREFQIRRKMAAEWDRPALFEAYSLFLFSPRYTREHPENVQAWIDRAVSHPEQAGDREIALRRIEMILAHDVFSRLPEINHPTLVTCGNQNNCTPLPLSEELARTIPNADLVVFDEGGELIELEQEEKFFQTVSRFIARH
jgi:aminoacrylate hydrolase